jgi:hypothetical protein
MLLFYLIYYWNWKGRVVGALCLFYELIYSGLIEKFIHFILLLYHAHDDAIVVMP